MQAATHRHVPVTMAGVFTRAGPRGRLEPRGQKAQPAGPRRLGWRPRGPAAREPAARRLCWGCSPPSGALGKRLPAAQSLLTPWGSRCYNTHLRGHWSVRNTTPNGSPQRRRHRVLRPWQLLAGAGKANHVASSTGFLKQRDVS